MAIVSKWLMNDTSANTMIDAVWGITMTASGTSTAQGIDWWAITYATNWYAIKTSYTMPLNHTISFWINLVDTNNTQYFFKTDGSNPGIYIRFISAFATSLNFDYNNSSWQRRINYPRASLTTWTWVNIVMTNQWNWVTVVFINWVQYEVSASTGSGINKSPNMNIWWYDTWTWNNPHWKIDNFTIYNTILSWAEIKNNYSFIKWFI